MENEGIKKSKRLYFLLIWLAISIFVLVTPKMPLYTFDYLIGYPLGLVGHFLADHHLKTVKQELEKLPNLEVVRIETNYDENIVNTLVKVKHKGYLQFIKLNKESFYDSPHLLVNRFGNLQILSLCQPNGIGRANVKLDIGIQGDESSFFPFRMRNVRDVVDHYDDIMAVIQTWPTDHSDPRAPRLETKTKDGKTVECFYAVEKAS